ncbi:MAG TPA: helix-turn-helix domain-containing protein [Syntrophorhabdaceae bacterium]|nr:helix-turn-helix domain-containing protein [Syntrophorhabdaceae bacterium]
MPIDLSKIGAILKERRESKGLTLEDVSASLCVRKSLVHALESGTWEMLPHEVYVRGYIKEYAHLLNIYEEIVSDLLQNDEIKATIDVPIQVKSEPRARRLPKKSNRISVCTCSVSRVRYTKSGEQKPAASTNQTGGTQDTSE